MKCKDIFFEKILENSMFTVFLDDDIKEHCACAETFPAGKLAYFKQARYKIMEKISGGRNYLIRMWYELNLCLDMFSDERKRNWVFDNLDRAKQRDLEHIKEKYHALGLDGVELSQKMEKEHKIKDSQYWEMIGNFWCKYSQYVAISKYIEELEAGETESSTGTTHKPALYPPEPQQKVGRKEEVLKDKMIDDADGRKMKTIHILMIGRKGKAAAFLIMCCIKKEWMKEPCFAEVEREFGNIGSRQGFDAQMDKLKMFEKAFTKEEIEETMTLLDATFASL